MKMKIKNYDVIIVGFGVSGISLAAQCQVNNLSYIVLERNSNFGGVWFDTTKETHLQTHKRFYQYSDFPFHKTIADHPDKKTILKYLRNYLDFKKVNIDEKVLWNFKVTNIKKHNNAWCVCDENGKQIYGNNIGICVGLFSQPKKPNINNNSQNINYYDFNKIVNLNEQSKITSIFKNKRVIIHGNGPTACDIIHIIKDVQNIDITVSIKKPKFYISKYFLGISTSKLVQPFILKFVKHFPPWMFYLLFSILEIFLVIFFRKKINTYVPYSKINSKNIVAKTVLNDKIKLAYHFGKWEENLYDINIWATGAESWINRIFLDYDNKNYLFIYNPNYDNCGFIGLSPSYNWLQVSEKQSKIFVKNIVKDVYPSKNEMIMWITKREKYCKKIGINFNDLTYDGLEFIKYRV
jgi:hypothetical protein